MYIYIRTYTKSLWILICFIVCDSSFCLLCSLLSLIVVHYARDCSCSCTCTSVDWVVVQSGLAIHVHVSMGLVPETMCGVLLCCLPGMRCCVTQYARARGAYGQVWL